MRYAYSALPQGSPYIFTLLVAEGGEWGRRSRDRVHIGVEEK
jgi:hypothetical protein